MAPPKGTSKYWQKHGPRLRELVEAGLTDQQIADAREFRRIGRAGVAAARRRLGIPPGDEYRDHHLTKFATISRVVSETPDRTVLAPEETEDEPFDELLARAIRETERDARKELVRRFAVARIVTTRPVALTFASDQHLTMRGPCDVRRAFTDAGIIQQTPGVYCVLGGDGVDNHIKHRAALVGKASRPSDEWRLYDGYLRVLGHKVLAVISGNHDDWTRDEAGVDMVGLLAGRHAIHYAPDEVVLHVQLVPDPKAEPSAEYVVKVRHQYQYNSSLNIGHAVKRMYDMGGDPFDVGVLCHNHAAHLETFDRHGETRWALRPGSYQVESAWSRRVGFGRSYPTCPGVVLWPGERRIEGFQDLLPLTERLADVRRMAA